MKAPWWVYRISIILIVNKNGKGINDPHESVRIWIVALAISALPVVWLGGSK